MSSTQDWRGLICTGRKLRDLQNVSSSCFEHDQHTGLKKLPKQGKELFQRIRGNSTQRSPRTGTYMFPLARLENFLIQEIPVRLFLASVVGWIDPKLNVSNAAQHIFNTSPEKIKLSTSNLTVSQNKAKNIYINTKYQAYKNIKFTMVSN